RTENECRLKPAPGRGKKEIRCHKGDQEPRFVARQRPGKKSDARTGGTRQRLRLAKTNRKVKGRRQCSKEDHLGHRNRLQIERIRVESIKSRRNARCCRAVQNAAYGRKEERQAHHKTNGRWNRAC